MRTVSQLSKLTGIKRRTVQYYATEKVPGKSGEGAGIIAPCHVSENSYRYFDDDALFKLFTIKTLKQCGYEPEAIKRFLESEEFDIAESADMQIKALERARRELDQQMQFLNLLKLLGIANQDNDEEMTVAIMSLLMKMLLISVEQVIREDDPDFTLDLESDEVKRAMSSRGDEQAAIMAQTYFKVMGHAEKGDMDLAVEALPEEIKTAIQEDSSVREDASSKAITTLEELFNAGISPRSKKAQRCAARIFQESFPRRRFVELKVANEFVGKLMQGTYAAILAELLCGEGFADYIAEVFGSYYATVKKYVEKKRASLEAAAQDQKEPLQVATS